MKTLQTIFIIMVLGIGQVAAVAHAAEVKLTASNAAAGDRFGRSVSISGDYAFVGKLPTGFSAPPPSVYIFVRSEDSWTLHAKLEGFGYHTSISGDYAIIGDSGNDDAGSNSGAAYIFVRSGTSWTLQAKRTASDAVAGESFGVSVSISGDYVIIGASNDDDAGDKSGSAYIFVRDGSSWTEQVKLTASDAAAEDYFGSSVSISGDTIIVGAFGDDDAGSRSGSAYIFCVERPIYGDVTGDGRVTALDAAVVLQACVGLTTLTPEQDELANVSGEGGVTAYDASLIMQYVIDLLTKFPVEGGLAAPAQ